jgi:hypothetical protein
MNTLDCVLYRPELLQHIDMPQPDKFTDDMWNWVINIAGNNISDLVRLLKLIRDIHVTLKEEITIQRVRVLCSAPFYIDFIPLLTAMSTSDTLSAIKSLLYIWKRGYAYDDILESFQVINQLFGTNSFKDNILIHKFLINSWISYCKGNTSILALQNVIYKTLQDKELSLSTL